MMLPAPQVGQMSSSQHVKVSSQEHEALLRLLEVAATDSGQARRVADLLAWWSSGSCGPFDITTAWGLDAKLAEDVITVSLLRSGANSYPDLGHGEAFERVVHASRPELKG